MCLTPGTSRSTRLGIFTIIFQRLRKKKLKKILKCLTNFVDFQLSALQLLRFSVLQDAVRSFKKAINLLMSSAKILPKTFENAEIYYLTGRCYMEQKSLLRVGINYIEYISL